MPVLRQVPDLWGYEWFVDLQRLKNNPHEVEVTVNLLLMPREFIDSALDSFERFDLAHFVFFRATLKKRCPVMNGESLDGEAKLKCRIRERRSVLAFGADSQPRATLGEVMREAWLMTGGDLLLCHTRPNAAVQPQRATSAGTAC
jgi:hypothetical protein